jgi:arylsulfatase A-like enzyme
VFTGRVHREYPVTQTAAVLLHVAWTCFLVAAGLPSCVVDGDPERLRASSSPRVTPSSQADESPPNILVILTDDQRSDSLEVMPKTQRWFAQQGMTFTQAFVTTPLCCPSRASILTGRYAHNHGVLDNASAMELDQRSTLQRYLHDSGYRTGIAGKFLNEWDLTLNPPFFDRWAIFRDHLNYYGVDFNVNGTLQTVNGYSTDFVQEQALRFLADFERTDRRPWLLYVAPLASHKPFTPEPRYAGAPVPPQPLNPGVLEQDLSDKPPFLQDPELGPGGARLTRRQQLRTLMSADDMVGQVMAQLRRLGELDQTLAFYLSDNGFLAGEHGLVDKRLPYTQSAAIPLLIRWEGVVPAGGVDGRLVANVDVTPTALAAAGVSPSPRFPIDGHDLLDPSARSELFMEYFVDPVRPVPEWAAIRTTEHLYAQYYAADGTTIFREYYDLVEDPWELNNVLNDGPETNDPSDSFLDRLSRAVARGRRCIGAIGPHACP